MPGKRYLVSGLLVFWFLNMASVFAQSPESYSTFHCISLYWKPADGASDNECIVRFRAENEKYWRQGMSLWFDPNIHSGLSNRSKEYRGSIVDLVPGTMYEIELELKKTGTKATLFQSTMHEEFKIKKTISLDSGVFNLPLVINEGGSASEGYVLYESLGNNHIIDLERNYDNCVVVNASYVIIRGLILKGAKKDGISLMPVSHIVIEDCDISGWGSVVTSGTYAGFGVDRNSAINSGQIYVSNIIVQRNRIHHPYTDSNSWLEPVKGTHPNGPQAITLKYSRGFHIIRYNEIYSDMEHMFNDGMGSVMNNTFEGFPVRDSDIYGNRVSHCWDDPVEVEGAGMNVRVWSNYIDTSYQIFGLAPQSLGPCYVYRNVGNYTQRGPKPVSQWNEGGAFFKIGAPSTKEEFSKGRLIAIHNTALQPKAPPGWPTTTAGTQTGLNFSTDDKVQSNIVTRNNILNVRSGKASISDKKKNPSNDYDYDLYSGSISAVTGSEKNGINGIPRYANSNKAGEFFLDTSSPGFDAGVVLPNFNDTYSGKGPDMGAFEKGLPALKFGMDADWNEWVGKINELYTYKDTMEINDTTATGILSDNLASLHVYPNPASEVIMIKIPDDQGISSLFIYDMTGRCSISYQYNEWIYGTVSVDISSLQSGIYIIDVITNTGSRRAFSAIF